MPVVGHFHRVIPREGGDLRRDGYVHLDIAAEHLKGEFPLFVRGLALIKGGTAHEGVEVGIDGAGGIIDRQLSRVRFIVEYPHRDTRFGNQDGIEFSSG